MKNHLRILSALLILVFFLTVLPSGSFCLPVYASAEEGMGTPGDEEALPGESEVPTEDGTTGYDHEPSEGTGSNEPASGGAVSGVPSDAPIDAAAETTGPSGEKSGITAEKDAPAYGETQTTEAVAEETAPDTAPASPDIFRLILIVICAGLLICVILLALQLRRVNAENRQLKAGIADRESKEMSSVAKTSQQPPVKAPSAVTAPSFFAEGLSGFYAGKLIPVRQQVVFGRDPACDIRFPSETSGISKVHCALIPDKGGVRLVDLGSSCGTFLGAGKPLQPHHSYILHHGDTFFLGNPDHSFRIK